MASDGLGKLQKKKSKLAGKLHCRPKSLLGEFGSSLRGFLTTSFLRESSRHPTRPNAGQNDYKEEEKTPDTMTGVEVCHCQTDEAGTGDGPRIEGPSSELAEISTKESTESIKSLLEEFGSSLKDLLTTSFLRQPTNAGQNDYKEGEKTPETKTGVEVCQMDEAGTGVDPLIQRPSQVLTEMNVRATREGIKVEVDFFDLLLIARSFSAKTSEALSQSFSLTGGVPQGSVHGPHLFNIYTTPFSLLRKVPAAEDHKLYVDEIQLFISFSPDISSDSIDHLRAVTKYCSW